MQRNGLVVVVRRVGVGGGRDAAAERGRLGVRARAEARDGGCDGAAQQRRRGRCARKGGGLGGRGRAPRLASQRETHCGGLLFLRVGFGDWFVGQTGVGDGGGWGEASGEDGWVSFDYKGPW